MLLELIASCGALTGQLLHVRYGVECVGDFHAQEGLDGVLQGDDALGPPYSSTTRTMCCFKSTSVSRSCPTDIDEGTVCIQESEGHLLFM